MIQRTPFFKIFDHYERFLTCRIRDPGTVKMRVKRDLEQAGAFYVFDVLGKNYLIYCLKHFLVSHFLSPVVNGFWGLSLNFKAVCQNADKAA